MASKSEKTTADALLEGVKRWVLAGTSACVAESATYPIDFTKTRMQLQNELGRSLGGGAPEVRHWEAGRRAGRGTPHA
jgi:hypothetical protein